MKIPRNISGGQLAKLLEVYGYEITHQVGSHIRLTTQKNGEHHITLPLHKAIHMAVSYTHLDVYKRQGLPLNSF